MISPECFQIEWIRTHVRATGSRNPVLLEKAILAFQLLGHLVENGVPLQFKGGTSLLLRLNPIRRLSIDIDIVTQATPDALQAILAKIAPAPPFNGFEHDAERDRDLPPKKHYRLFYPSVVEAGKRDHVLLDVLFEPEEAPHCEPVAIATSFLSLEREVRVPVPTVNALLGDKLTAFAPRTIGILHDERRRTDIAKQLFDVGVLFDAATDLQAATDVYAAIHARQLKYRGASYSLEETLQDTIESGFLYSQIDLAGGTKDERGLFIQEGVSRLQNHLVNLPFGRDHARIAAGKAACAAAWIARKPAIRIEDLLFRNERERIEELRHQQIDGAWKPLTRLKGGNPEAFHYWLKAHQILQG